MVAVLPEGVELPLLADPIGSSAFDHLHCFFEGGSSSWSEQNMQVIRQHTELVQEKVARLPTPYDLVCQDLRHVALEELTGAQQSMVTK
jgi:hypothetical protein